MDKKTKSGLYGTRTEKNLLSALAKKSGAYTRYGLFGAKAYEDGDAAVGEDFYKTASEEKEHARVFAEYLGLIDATEKNLEYTVASEKYDSESLFPEFATVADEEGFDEIAEKFRDIGSIEKENLEKYTRLLDEYKNGTLTSSTDPDTKWICSNCGYTATQVSAPERCPVCSLPSGYFKKKLCVCKNHG